MLAELKRLCVRALKEGPMDMSEKSSFIASIDPKKHEKYSGNLVSWLKKHMKGSRVPNVYRGVGGSEFFEGRIFIGWDGLGGCCRDFTGSHLWRVLCVGSRAEYAAWVGNGKLVLMESFWKDYLRIGRCALDGAHEHSFLNAEGRYSVDGDRRTCTWCGAEMRRERYTETIVHERERWVLDGKEG